MRHLGRKVYVAAGYNTTFFGSGRREFNPHSPMPTFETYLQEAADGVRAQVSEPIYDEGVIGSFMPGRFINQANLPGLLPAFVPSLLGRPCTGVEGACGTGGRAIATAVRSVLSGLAETVYVAGFEMQNTVKAVYGADILAGAGYYAKERKKGQAFFFPGIFSDRAGAYYDKYGYEHTREAMALWYQQSILNARKNSKAQEYHNTTEDLYRRAMARPDPKRFVPHLNPYDCSKVSDGASALLVASEAGLKECGIDLDHAIEIVAMGEAQGDLTQKPADLTHLATTTLAVGSALNQVDFGLEELGMLELHDCFSITAILGLEAIGLAQPGHGAELIIQGKTAPNGLIPTNLSGGLGGFGHPTGATGVRQMVDLWQQLTGAAENPVRIKKPHGMMVSMGGDDKTVTCFIVRGGNCPSRP